MRLQCYFCGKSVSNEVPQDTVIRAVLVCPECIEAHKIEIPEPPPDKPWPVCRVCGIRSNYMLDGVAQPTCYAHRNIHEAPVGGKA